MMLAEELHFGHAAHRLGIAQPPLSQQIKRLEAAVGHELFYRSTRKVSLTPIGAELLETARTLLVQLAIGLDRIDHLAMVGASRIAVGFTATTSLRILPAIVRKFRSEHRETQIELIELLPGQMRGALLAEQIDVALVRGPQAMADLEAVTLVIERFVAVLPEGHDMASPSAPFNLAELAEEQFVLFPRDRASEYLTRTLWLCEQAGFVPNVVEVHGWQTAISMVGSGMGVSILPESVAMLGTPGVVYRPIESSGFPVCLLQRKGDKATVVRQFISCATAAAPSFEISA